MLSYLKSAPSNLSNSKILWNNENALIWDQNCLIWVFLTKKCLIWVFLGKKFKNTIVIFESSTLKFFCLQNFTEKQKMPKFVNKKVWFGDFWAGTWKQYCHILKPAPSNLSNCKISWKKQECLNLGPKMP